MKVTRNKTGRFKSKSVLAVICLAGLLAVLPTQAQDAPVSSMAAQEAALLTGKWELAESDNAPSGIVNRIQFFSEGTGIIGYSQDFTWELEDGCLELESYGSVHTYDFEVSEDTLTCFYDKAHNSFAVYKKTAAGSDGTKTDEISIHDIITLNSRITYYKITYASKLFVENGELIEKDKEKYITEYFDENNNVIKKIIGSYVYYTFYEYDSTGNQIGIKHYDKDRIVSFRDEFIADNDGKIISVITYDENDTISGKTKYIYDYNGNIIQKLKFVETEKYRYSVIWEYNNDKVYSMTRYSHNDVLSEVYTYDCDGKLVETKGYHNRFLIYRSEILEYDNKTRTLKEYTESDGKPARMDYYEYHDN
jgi:hypothetical protein